MAIFDKNESKTPQQAMDELDEPEPAELEEQPLEPVEGDEPAPETPEGEPTEPAPGEGQEPETDEQGNLLDAAPAPIAAEDFTPLTFRQGGRTYEIAGAVRAKDGLYIPAERADAVIQAIQRGVHHDTTWQQQMAEKDAEIARLSIDFNEEVVAAGTMLAELQKHLATPESAQEFLNNFPHYKALLESKVDGAKERAKREFMEKHGAAISRAPAALEEGGQDWVQATTKALFNYADDMVERGEFRGMFAPEEQKDLGLFLGRHARSYLTKADKDYPEDGIRAGQTVINLQALSADIREYGQRLGRGRKAVTAQDRAKKFNAAARRPAPGRQIPAGQPPVRGRVAGPPKNRKEWMAGLQKFVAAETGAQE